MEQNKSGSNTTLKWLVGILVVIIIGLIGYIVYSKSISKPEVSTTIPSNNTATATPTNLSTSTTEWQTYTNSKYSYSIKYPNNFSPKDITETITSGAVEQNKYYLNIVSFDDKGKKIGFSINIESLTPEQIYEKTGYSISYSQKEDYVLDDIKGIKIFSNDPVREDNSKRIEAVVIANNSQTYVISRGNIDYTQFDQILQTFKFTK